MIDKNVKSKNNFFSNYIHGIFNNRELPFERKERVEILAKNIAELLKEKKQLEVTDIAEEYDVTIIDVISAIDLLKVKGIIREIDETGTS